MIPRPPLEALNPRVDRDLEAVCLKCLKKDPKDRYESAEAFGRELQRWLDGRPVHARSISLPEKVWKWARREPLQALAVGAGAALIVLVVAMGFSNAAYRSKVIEDEAAKLIAEHKREISEQQKELADKQAELAQANSTLTLRTAGEAVARLLDAFETELGAEAQQQALRMRLFGHALHYFEGVIQRYQGKPNMDRPNRLELARAHQQVAKLAGRIGADRREVVTKNYEASIAILEDLTRKTSPEKSGDDSEATILCELGGAYLEYGIVRWGRGESDALDFYHKGRGAFERACQPCPMHQGHRECGCVGEIDARAGLGRSWGYIGDVHEVAGRVAEAETAYSASHKIRQKLHEDYKNDPTVGPEMSLQLGRSFGNLAVLARHRGEQSLAILEERKAVELQDDLIAKASSDANRRQAREDLVYYLRQFARLRLENAEPEKAIAEANRAIEQSAKLVADRPGVVSYRIEKAASLLVLAEAKLALGDRPGVNQSCRAAANLLEEARDFRDSLDYRLAGIRRDVLVGKLALREKRADEAREPLAQAKDSLESLIEKDPQNDEYRSDHAEVLSLLAQVFRTTDPSRAADLFKSARTEQLRVIQEGSEGRIKLYQSRLDRIEALRSQLD